MAEKLAGRSYGRRAWIIIAIVVVIGAGTAASFGLALSAQPAPQGSATAFATATVQREDLVDYVTMDAVVGYGASVPVTVKATGTFTWLAAAGSAVARGEALARVDEQPVVLFYGSVPMYRPLNVGTKGSDVHQLEQNLHALGYGGFTVDSQFSEATKDAVRRWQRDLGVADTGSVDVSQIVYAPGAVHIEEQLVRPGAAAPADALTVTGTTKVVSASVASSEGSWAAPGVQVSVVGADGSVAPGEVTAVAPGSGGEDGEHIQLTIAVKDQALLAEQARHLTVQYEARRKDGVLTVPVSALLALAEGGYGLEIILPDGSSRIVAVKAGMFANGRVEVSGAGIAEGTTVRMPQ